jgi:hypothetical protein
MNNLLTMFLQLRNVIISLLSVFGLPLAMTIALANFSLAVIAIVLLLIFPQLAVVVLLVLLVLLAIRH